MRLLHKINLVLAVVSLCGVAHAETDLKAVQDNRGKVVITKDAQCVRHQWDTRHDICAPEQAPPPPPPPPPVVAAPPPPPPAPEIALEQRTVYFNFDKDALLPEAQAKLDALADTVKNSRGITKASVVGYADIIGKNDYNIHLSEHRANNVQAYLAARVSIPVDVLSVRGLGSANPTTHCPAKMKRSERIACLAQDRRVEVEFTYEK